MSENAGLKSSEVGFIPQLSVDCAVLGFDDGKLKVLLLRYKATNSWSLPGGLVKQNESVDDAAVRVLKERTQLNHIYMQQCHVFGAVARYDQEKVKTTLKHLIPVDAWFERTVSVGYYALVAFEKTQPTPDAYSDVCQWWDLDAVPELLFDHANIIEQARLALKKQISWQPVGYKLLPELFTMPELQKLYEAILHRKIDPRNFQKKMMGLGFLERTGEKRKGVAHKAPYLYKFIPEPYEALLEDGYLMFR